MTSLRTAPNLAAPDTFYEALIEAHHELSLEQSHEMNAALVLLLCNHIGDTAVLCEALQLARDVARNPSTESGEA